MHNRMNTALEDWKIANKKLFAQKNHQIYHLKRKNYYFFRPTRVDHVNCVDILNIMRYTKITQRCSLTS